MTTPEQIEAFIRATRPPWNVARQAYDWYGMCAGLTYRTILECGGTVPDGPYSSAWAAYLATRIESTDPRQCPPGGVHYWDYTGLASNGQRARWGHVTLDILGGGTDTLSATGHAHEFWKRSAGLISVAAQTARGMEYMGWSRTYGRSNRIDITTGHIAGGGSTPFPEEDDMYTDEDRKKAAADQERNTATWRRTARILRGLCETPDYQATSVYQKALTEVDRIYLKLLGRHIDAASQPSRVYDRLSGQTDAQLEASIKASTEYKAKNP